MYSGGSPGRFACMPTLLRAALASVLASAALAAPAPAFTESTYDVTLDIEGTYSMVDRVPDGSMTHSVSAAFRIVAVNRGYTFTGSVPTGAARPDEVHVTALASERIKVVNEAGTAEGECSGKTLQSTTPGTLLFGSAGATEMFGQHIPVDDLTIVETCSGPAAPPSSTVRLTDPDPIHAGFSLPLEAVHDGMGLIRIEVARSQGAACPMADEHTYHCAFDWKGTITFVKTGSREVADEQPVPSHDGRSTAPPREEVAAPAPAPAPAAPAAPAGARAPSPVEVVRATVRPGAAVASLAVGCRVACWGTVKAFPWRRGGRARAAAARALASTRFSLAAAGSKAVRVRFGRAARRAIARAGGVRLVVETRLAGGGVERRTVTLPVRG